MSYTVPDHLAPPSRRRTGPALVTLMVPSGVFWLGLGCTGLIYVKSFDSPEGLATFAAGVMGLLGSVVTLALTIATGVVAAYHRAGTERRWPLAVVVTCAVLVVGLLAWWAVALIR